MPTLIRILLILVLLSHGVALFIDYTVQVCGGVQINYPFEVRHKGTSQDYFEVTCANITTTTSPTTLKQKPILTKLNLELLGMIDQPLSDVNSGRAFGRIIVNMPVFEDCTSQNNNISNWSSVNLSGSPFYYDVKLNSFFSIGCYTKASVYDNEGVVLATCQNGASHCNCSQADLITQDPFLRAYRLEVKRTGMFKRGSCQTALLIKSYEYANLVDAKHVPLVLGWYMDDYKEVVIVLVCACCCCPWCCWHCKTRKQRKEARLREKYFYRRLNECAANREMVSKTKLFTLKDLKKATHNFSDDRVLGRGGQGIVYKGMLRNGQIIAVKKSITFEESQWNDFINELVLLSQVNHRNIVKILGCCLESQVPLLVYEFILNGTLFQHIQNSTGESLLTWEMRLKIASEAADAIAYLHSSSTNPIYHRDIKSTNILLDDKYRAKVSDFGIAKVLSIDQSHMTTRVQGTFGYLDPEYFRSSQYSDKSDVYSFGVILVELLTGQPPIRNTSVVEEERSLVAYFISRINNNGLEEVLDPLVIAGSIREEVTIIANLAKQCLHSIGAARPTMKEVVEEIERLRRKPKIVRNCFEIDNCTSSSTILEMGGAYPYTYPTVLDFPKYDGDQDEVRPLFCTT